MKTIDIFLNILFPKKRRSRGADKLSKDDLFNLMDRGNIKGNHYLLPYKDERVKDFIHSLRYENNPNSITLAAEILLTFLEEEYLEQSLIGKEQFKLIQIPVSRGRIRKEGYDHLNKVLEKLKTLLIKGNITVSLEDILRWKRKTKRQLSTKSYKERFENVNYGLECEDSNLEDSVCIVFDDILKTGFTLNEARRILKENKAKKIITVAFAH